MTEKRVINPRNPTLLPSIRVTRAGRVKNRAERDQPKLLVSVSLVAFQRQMSVRPGGERWQKETSQPILISHQPGSGNLGLRSTALLGTFLQVSLGIPWKNQIVNERQLTTCLTQATIVSWAYEANSARCQTTCRSSYGLRPRDRKRQTEGAGQPARFATGYRPAQEN